MSISDVQGHAHDAFKASVNALREVMRNNTGAFFSQIQVPDFDTISSIEIAASEIDSSIEQILMAMRTKNQSKSRILGARHLLKRCFRASFHFAQLFLTVLKAGSAISVLNPCGIVCEAMLLLINIAYEESRREEEISITMDTLSVALARIQLLRSIPNDVSVSQLDKIRGSALDLSSTILDYLTLAMRRLTSSSTLSFARNLFAGTGDFKEATRKIAMAIVAYNTTLGDFGLLTMIETNSILKGTAEGISATAQEVSTNIRVMSTVVESASSTVQDLSRKIDDIGNTYSVDFLIEAHTTALRSLYIHDAEWLETQGFLKSATRQQILHWLSAINFERQQKVVRAKRVEGSGTWFLNHPTFRAWVSGDSSHTLSIVIDELETRRAANDIGIAYLYFDYKEQESQSAVGVVASLVRQLISQVEDIIPDLYILYKTFRSRGKTPELQHLIEALIVASESFTCSIIILDALDECDRVQRRYLLQVLQRLRPPAFKIFTTSRPHLMDGKSYFNDCASIWISADFTDIVSFLSVRVNEERPRYRKLKTKIVEKLSVAANGIFLLAEAQLNYVLRFVQPKDMKLALDSSTVPDELFELYERVIASINRKSNDTPEVVRRILSWIYHARRTLKMTELREAIAVGPGDSETDEEDWMDPDDIVELCESLVIHDADSDTVRFSHEQVQIFLQAKTESYLLSETDIASACLNYFFLEAFGEGPASDELTFRKRIQRHPFYVYAARYWGAHLRAADAELNGDICALLIELCKCQAKVDALFQMEKAKKLLDAWAVGKNQWLPGGSLLHLSAETGLEKLCRWTLENAEHIWGHASVTEILINAGADINAQSASGRSSMILASSWGHIEVVRRLVGAGACTEIKDNTGATALHVAAKFGHWSVVQLLLESAAKVDPVDNDGRTPLFCAAENGHLGVLDILFEAQPAPKLNSQQDFAGSLRSASANGHVSIVRRLLEIGVHPDLSHVLPDGNLSTALYEAASYGRLDVVNVLLDAGASVESRNLRVKWSPLHTASFHEYEDVVKRLLEARANIEATTFDGFTALNIAANEGYVSIVDILLKANAKLHGVANVTPLHMAAREGHHAVVSSLLNAGSEIDAQTSAGVTALHLASRQNNIAIVKMLLERNANSKIRGQGGNTPLHIAAGMGHIEVAKLLTNANTITLKNDKGETPLRNAFAHGHSTFVSILSEAAGKLSIPDTWNWAVLFSTSAQVHFSINSLTHWRRFALVPNDRTIEQLDISNEEEGLEQIISWLGSLDWEAENWKSWPFEDFFHHADFVEAEKWNRAMEALDNDEKFGRYLGRVAATLWVTGETSNNSDLETAFRLALKCYWRRQGRSKSTFEELCELSDTQFEGLLDWVGVTLPRPSMRSDLSLGAAYSVVQRWDYAIASYERAVRVCDSNIEHWQLVSLAYQRKGKLDDGVKFFEAMVEKFPADISARYLLAASYEERSEFDAAIAVYETVVEMKQDLQAWLHLAAAYGKRGDYDGEAKVYKLAYDKAPSGLISSQEETRLYLSHRMGQAFVKNQSFDEAITIYQTLLEKEPKQSTVRNSLASVYRLKRLDTEAITLWETSLRDDPHDRSAWSSLIELYENRNDVELVVKAFEDRHRDDPADEWVVHSFGRFYHSIGEFRKAIECYASVEQPKWSENDWKYFGRSYVAMQEFDKAIDLYKTVLENNPNFIALWLDLVEVYKLKGDKDGASAQVEKATEAYANRLEKNPTNMRALADLAYIYYAKGSYEQAIEMFEAALHIEPTTSWLLRYIGHCYKAKGELSRAIELYDRHYLEHYHENRYVHNVQDLKMYAVLCDGCGACPVSGLCHKCLICFDYDLCDRCRKQNPGLHSEHEFFTLPSRALLSQLGLHLELI